MNKLALSFGLLFGHKKQLKESLWVIENCNVHFSHLFHILTIEGSLD